MSDENSEKPNKIEKIYHIIEFEIDNANTQISLSKKDNINFILLILALIGLFAFVPADTFFYEWISNGLWMAGVLIAIVCGTSILFYYIVLNKEKTNKMGVSNIENEDKCALCKTSVICKNITDPERKEKMRDYSNTLIVNTISLFFSALIYTSFIFFITSAFAYMYYSNSKDISPTFQTDSWISFILTLILLGYILFYFKHKSLLKKRDFKKYISRVALFSSPILICFAIMAIYGFVSKIPPFIAISNGTQFSPLLTEHLKIIPALPLSYIVAVFTLVVGLVLFEFFVSSQYIQDISKKLGMLLILKHKVERYQLGISPDLNVEEVIKQLSKLKIFPPSYHVAGGIITIPLILPEVPCEEMLYSALEDQPGEVQETWQK
jgi:magnesium-transporting ATPase (P-type)